MQLSQYSEIIWRNLRSRVSAMVLVGLAPLVSTDRARKQKALWSDRRGVTTIEYLILVGLLALGLLGAFRAFTTSVDKTSDAEARAVVSLTWDGKTQKTSYSAPALSVDGSGSKTSEHSQKKECSGFWSCAWEKTKDVAGAVTDYQHWPGWVKTTVTVVAAVAVGIAVGALVVATAPAWLTGLALAAVVIIAGGIAAGAVGGGLNAAMTEGASVLDGIGKGAVLGFVGSAVFAAALPLELGVLGMMAVGGIAGAATYLADCGIFGTPWSTTDFVASVAFGAVLGGLGRWVAGKISLNRAIKASGKPSGVGTLRAREVPYHRPPECYEAAPGKQLPPLDPAKGKYLWVIKDDGTVVVAPENQPGFGVNKGYPETVNGRQVKHGDLSPGPNGETRGVARAGGEFVPEYDGNGNFTGKWTMNNDSSYTFNRTDGTELKPENLQAAKKVFKAAGLDVSKMELKGYDGTSVAGD